MQGGLGKRWVEVAAVGCTEVCTYLHGHAVKTSSELVRKWPQPSPTPASSTHNRDLRANPHSHSSTPLPPGSILIL